MKDKFTKDLLDLCRLNQMEENIKDSPAVDRDSTLRLIDIVKDYRLGEGKKRSHG